LLFLQVSQPTLWGQIVPWGEVWGVVRSKTSRLGKGRPHACHNSAPRSSRLRRSWSLQFSPTAVFTI